MKILGINAYHGDSSACLLIDGEIRCAIEEERINRIKHWAGFPLESVRWCLESEKINIEELDYIAISRDPFARVHKKIFRLLKKTPGIKFIKDRFSNLKKIKKIDEILLEEFSKEKSNPKLNIINVDHHKAHIASSYYPSEFSDAACISVDGFGDFLSVMRGFATNGNFTEIDTVQYPHSLGIFYTAITQFLGFNNYGDEYKVMGLSAYGEPVYKDQLRKAVRYENDGLFSLDTSYFLHDSEGVEMTWREGAPTIGKIYSDRMSNLLGEPRTNNEELCQRHMDIASSAQCIYEEAFFHLLDGLYEKTGCSNICLSGGCIQNSLANGKILSKTKFTDLYIPPSAHDGGTSAGAALWAWNKYSGNNSAKNNFSPYLGPEYNDAEIKLILDENSGVEYSYLENNQLFQTVAENLAEGMIIGWFQGRSEWGPRALGNRSIICDPSYPNMKEIINTKIKRRESFRPFAPSVLEEHVGEWFELVHPVRYMEMVYKIKNDKREIIPSVCHSDGTGRLQTVDKILNEKYYKLISAFYELKNIPMLLNTSFNENEPIVNHPQQAIDCFQRTKMDLLVLGNFIVKRINQ